MDIMPVKVTTHQESEKRAAGFKGIVHHFLRIYKKLIVDIIHRVRLFCDIEERGDDGNYTDNRENIQFFVITVDFILAETDDKDNDAGFQKSDNHILRGVHSEKVS